MKETTFDQRTREFLHQQSQILIDQRTVLEKQAYNIICYILNDIPTKQLAFTDDENGDDLVISVPNKKGEIEVRYVNAIALQGEELILIDETNMEWRLWEISELTCVDLLSEMTYELQRETVVNTL